MILDTNVISELMRPTPSARVVGWVDAQDQNLLFITAVTLAESLYGIERMSEGRRKTELSRYFRQMLERRFSSRILSYDESAATTYAIVVTHRERIGRRIETEDAQIASICLANGAVLATRNTKDFEHTGVELINPWDS